MYINELKHDLEATYVKMRSPALNKLKWIDAFLQMDNIIPHRKDEKLEKHANNVQKSSYNIQREVEKKLVLRKI